MYGGLIADPSTHINNSKPINLSFTKQQLGHGEFFIYKFIAHI